MALAGGRVQRRCRVFPHCCGEPDPIGRTADSTDVNRLSIFLVPQLLTAKPIHFAGL